MYGDTSSSEPTRLDGYDNHELLLMSQHSHGLERAAINEVIALRDENAKLTRQLTRDGKSAILSATGD